MQFYFFGFPDTDFVKIVRSEFNLEVQRGYIALEREGVISNKLHSGGRVH